MTSPFLAGLNNIALFNISEIAKIEMTRFTPHDGPHIFNYYNLTITATQIYYIQKKIKWNSQIIAYLVPAKYTNFSLNNLHDFPPPQNL